VQNNSKIVQNTMQKNAFLTRCDSCDFYVFSQLCKGCGLCITKCPKKVLNWSPELGLYGTPVVELVEKSENSQNACNACGLCAMYCPDCAIKIIKK